MSGVSKESVNVAVGILIAMVLLRVLKNFFRPTAPAKHANGAPYIPGQVQL
jgi:hypothetical protein